MAINVSLEMTDTFNQWVEKINSLADQANTEIENIESSTDYSVFTGATETTNGTNGLVPAPQAGDTHKWLKGDGTWGENEYIYCYSNNEKVERKRFMLIKPNDPHVYMSPIDKGIIYNSDRTTYIMQMDKFICNCATATYGTTHLNKFNYNGFMCDFNNNIIRYGVCSTSGSQKNKIVNTEIPYQVILKENNNKSLRPIIRIKFENTNTASNITLNVNNSGDYYIVQSLLGNTSSKLHKITPSRIKAGRVYTFVMLNAYSSNIEDEDLNDVPIWYMIGGSELTANHFEELVSETSILGPTSIQVNSTNLYAVSAHSYSNAIITNYEIQCYDEKNNIILENNVSASKNEYTPIEVGNFDTSINTKTCTLSVVAVDEYGNKGNAGQKVLSCNN